VHRAWVEFVTRGEPGWPGYDTATRTTALLADRLEVVSDPQPETRLAW
jgi:para-nitrobenzyl esterase